jgi:membrane protease subunit HflC
MKSLIVVVVLVIIGIIVLRQSLFTVNETEQVLVLRFGEVKNVRTAPGLYTKAPFLDTATHYSRRILLVDNPPERMLDKDINVLEIDVYARYKIVDPVQFRKTLRTEVSARSILGQRINAALRAEVATRNREEIIGGRPQKDQAGNVVVDEEGNTRVIPTNTRTEILDKVLEDVRQDLAQEQEQSGIEMIDVRIKRADFPGEVGERIFARMRSERERIARGQRAEGEEEAQRIRAQASRLQEVILAEADRDSNILRGEGEAEAIRRLAEALGENQEFFAFRRSLEAYRKFLNQQTTVILPADSDLFQYLQSPNPPVKPSGKK